MSDAKDRTKRNITMQNNSVTMQPTRRDVWRRPSMHVCHLSLNHTSTHTTLADVGDMHHTIHKL